MPASFVCFVLRKKEAQKTGKFYPKGACANSVIYGLAGGLDFIVLFPENVMIFPACFLKPEIVLFLPIL